MKKISFFQGVVIALAMSLSGSLLFVILAPLFGGYGVLRALIGLLSLGYVSYLLHISGIRVGRIITVAIWSIVACVSWFYLPSLLSYTLTHAVLIWLVRAFYLHKSILTALLDLGLVGLGAIAAISAGLQTNSLFLSLWCFFLVQAAFVVIPRFARNREKKKQVLDDSRFQYAYRNAEAALRRISSL